MAQTQPGGLYEVDGELVDANGNPAKREAVSGSSDAGEGGDETSLDNVSFGSPAARKLAETNGMTALTFKGRRKSSESGFTKADVERIHAATDDGDEDAE